MTAAASGLTKLRFLGRTAERRGRAFAAGDGSRDRVEITGADLVLVLRRRIPALGGREFGFLQFGIGSHTASGIAMRQIEHRIIERVKSGESDELKFVAHRGELALESVDRR